MLTTFAAIFKNLETLSMQRILVLLFVLFAVALSGQEHGHDDHNHDHDHHNEVSHDDHGHDAHGDDHHAEYDPSATAIHHVGDANVINILDFVKIPLPMILYSKDQGWSMFSSAKFEPGHHDNGHAAYDGYVLFEGNVHRLKDGSMLQGEHEVHGFAHGAKVIDGKEKDVAYAMIDGHKYEIEPRTTYDGGLLGGGVTSFYDFSITKNVVSIFIVALILFLIFRSIAKSYQRNEGEAPKGIQSLMEPLIIFIRDEVAISFIGEKRYEEFLPLLLTLFFFILGLNLWGQVPFLGSANVTGSLTVSLVLAVIVFLITNFNGNKHYWGHILWMPGVPVAIKPLLSVIEILGMFIKPLTLMLRLAGNITAGHIAILSFIGLIFVFGESGKNMTGGVIGTLMAVPLTMFMMAIELLVAFIQAYVFTLLTASYIGAAIEEHH